MVSVTNNSNKRCVIIAAAPNQDISKFKKIISQDDFIISADGGQKLANKLGVLTDYIIGDFDSFDIDVANKTTAKIKKLPSIKDDTDTMAAARLAHEMGFDEVVIIGAIGGRFDHTIANLAVMQWLTSHNIKATIINEYGTMSMYLPGKYEILSDGYKYLSLLAYGGDVTGVTIKKVFYPLKNATIKTDFPIGVSNEFLNQKAELSFTSGTLMVFKNNDK